MVFNNNLLLGAAGQSGVFDTTLIERSAWFDGAADNLTKSFGSGADQQEFVLAAWVKRNSFGSLQFFFGSGTGARQFGFGFTASDQLELRDYDAPINARYITNALFRDIGWYHVLTSIKTSEIVANNRVKIFVNGSEITSFSTETDPSLNFDMNWGISGDTHAIGSYFAGSGGNFFKGYITQAVYISGKSIQGGDFTISNFLDTYTFGANGSQYVPRADATIAALATAAGGNSFCLTTAIGDGTDASGNGNNFTPTSMSDAANGSADTPSLVYPVLNILDRGDTGLATFKDGNEFTVSNAVAGFMRATMSADTGKFYYECQIDGLPSANFQFGMQDTVALNTGYASVGNGFVLNIASSGTINLYEGGTAGASQETGVTDAAHAFQCAVDFDSGKFWFGRDDTWYGSGNPEAGTNETGTFTAGLRLAPVVGRASSASTVAEQRLVWASGSFSGTMPTEFLEWNFANLPTPDYQGIDYFNPILYTGNGSTNAITGVGFQPDLVWIKNRTGATSHSLYDAVRGVQKQLESDNTSAETTETTGLTAFGSDGFTVGSLAQVNTNTNNFVGWSWLAGGAGASNTDGSITSTVSKAAADHFSIVTYTGTGAIATVGHGLGSVPGFFVVKKRTSGTCDYWPSWHKDLTSSYIPLDQSINQQSDSSIFNNTDPTSTVFTVGSGSNSTNTNASGSDYIAYCFAEVENLSKIGRYTGNGSVNGPFVWCGFRPAWVMVKRIDSTGAWAIFDNQREGYNVDNDELQANTTDAETTTDYVDILSNGFKLRSSDSHVNASGSTYIFMAFADIAGGGDLPPIYGR